MPFVERNYNKTSNSLARALYLELVSQINYELEIGIAIKMNKVLFNMETDVVLIFVY